MRFSVSLILFLLLAGSALISFVILAKLLDFKSNQIFHHYMEPTVLAF